MALEYSNNVEALNEQLTALRTEMNAVHQSNQRLIAENKERNEELASVKQKYSDLIDKLPSSEETTESVPNPDSTVIESIRKEALKTVASITALEGKWCSTDKILAEHGIILAEHGNILKDICFRLNLMEQYSRINSLLIHGLLLPKKTYGESLNEVVVKAINTALPDLVIPLIPQDIDIAHSLTTKKGGLKPVTIVKFARRTVRNRVFYAKSALKKNTSTNITITEHLTAFTMGLLSDVKNVVGRDNAWTSQTKIFANIGKDTNTGRDRKIQIRSYSDLEKLKAMMCYDPVAPSGTEQVAIPQPPPGFNINKHNNSHDINSTGNYPPRQGFINSYGNHPPRRGYSVHNRGGAGV